MHFVQKLWVWYHRSPLFSSTNWRPTHWQQRCTRYLLVACRLCQETRLSFPTCSGHWPVNTCVRLLPILPPLWTSWQREEVGKDIPSSWCDWLTSRVGGPWRRAAAREGASSQGGREENHSTGGTMLKLQHEVWQSTLCPSLKVFWK